MSKELITETPAVISRVADTTPFLSIGENMNDTEKAIFSGLMLIFAIYASYMASRGLEGTINSKLEKGLLVAGAIGVIALNALVNYDVWK